MKLVLAILRQSTALLLHASVFLLIATFIFTFLIANKQAVKDTLVESGIYDNFVTSVIDTNLNSVAEQTEGVPLRNTEVQKIIKASFSPRLLKDQTDSVVDNVYRWLDGSSDALMFSYDFTEPKNRMNESLARYAAERVSALPYCTSVLPEVNVFDVACQPPGFSYDFVYTRVLEDLRSSSFLENPVIDQDSLPKTSDGKTLQEKYAVVPRLYQLSKNSIYIAIVLFVLASVVFVYVRRPMAKGLTVLGHDLFTNGLMLILLTAVFGFLIPRYTNAFGIKGNETAELFSQVADTFIRKIDLLIIYIAVQSVAVGLGIVLVARLKKSTSTYRSFVYKSGIVESATEEESTGRRSTAPPVQTSEENRKKRRRAKTSRSKKYKKVKL